ncbi:MAG: hypothetical protein U5Q44_01470 [Dehalococcoidia bacterium]|nr:hypothetical protein [Dehalococcoidia bacterium]
MDLLNRLLNWLAPRVCAECEGGSGLKMDATRNVAWVCSRCHGSGDAADDGLQQLLESHVTAREEARPRKPRSAA